MSDNQMAQEGTKQQFTNHGKKKQTNQDPGIVKIENQSLTNDGEKKQINQSHVKIENQSLTNHAENTQSNQLNGRVKLENQYLSDNPETKINNNKATETQNGEKQAESETMILKVKESIELMSKTFPQIFKKQIVDKLNFTLLKKFKKNLPQESPFQPKNVTPKPQPPPPTQPTGKKRGRKSKLRLKMKSKNKEKQEDNKQIYYSDEQQKKEEEKKCPFRKPGRPKREGKAPDEKPKQTKPLRQIWNADFQKEFVDLLRTGKTFVEIRNLFAQKYPQYIDYFDYTQFRCEYYKVTRLGMKKLASIAKRNGSGLPKIQKSNFRRTGYLYYHKEGFHMRVKLIEFYARQQYDKKYLVETIKDLNSFYHSIDVKQEKKYKWAQQIVKKEPEIDEQPELKIDEDEYIDLRKL